MIAAALSLQDPRERPAEQQAQADQAHARFKDKGSDFLTWLNLWRHLKEQQRELSSSAFRRMCKREFLNYLRVREWQDFESQLRQVCKEMKVEIGRPADVPDADGIHQALLSGLLSHIGLLEEREKGRPAEGPAGVPRRPRRPVRDLPRLRAQGREPAVRDGRRAGRDLAALGPAERRGQPGVGRAARRAPGEAELLRAALVAQAGRGDGPRAGDAVRRAAGRGPADLLREGRRRAEPRALHPARAGVRRVGDAAQVLRAQPAAARGGRGARAPGPAARHRRRRAHAVRLLRRPGRRRGGQRRALRPVVEAGPAEAAGAADLRPVDAHPRDGRRGAGAGLPRALADPRG